MSPANHDLKTWFDHFDQLRGCVHNVRAGLPTTPDQLPQFFCTLLLSDTLVAPTPDDFAQAATFGALIDRRAALKPRVLEVMKQCAIEDGHCPAGKPTSAFAQENTTVSFPSADNRTNISHRLRLPSCDVLPCPPTWGSGLATAGKTNDQAAAEAQKC